MNIYHDNYSKINTSKKKCYNALSLVFSIAQHNTYRIKKQDHCYNILSPPTMDVPDSRGSQHHNAPTLTAHLFNITYNWLTIALAHYEVTSWCCLYIDIMRHYLWKYLQCMIFTDIFQSIINACVHLHTISWLTTDNITLLKNHYTNLKFLAVLSYKTNIVNNKNQQLLNWPNMKHTSLLLQTIP